jgi:nucleotide-binding universal stress UspA family protein
VCIGSYKDDILATDGSDEATRVARRAVEVPRERGATLHVLCVVDRRTMAEPALSAGELATIETADHGHEAIALVRDLADGTGVIVEGTTRHGVSHEETVDYAVAGGGDRG